MSLAASPASGQEALPIRALMLDLDKSSLRSDLTIDPEDREAVARLKESGVRISIATGRLPVLVCKYAQAFGVNAPIICCNGALIIREDNVGEPLFRTFLPARELYSVLCFLLEKDYDFELFSPDSFAYTHMRGEVAEVYEFNREVPEHWRAQTVVLNKDNLAYFASRSCSMLLHVRDGEDIMRQVKDRLRDPVVKLVRTIHDCCEILRADIDKGTAIREWSRLTDIPLEQIAAIGDSNNDIPILENVGTSIVMENGSPRLKALADFLTKDNDHNGLAWAIDHCILKKNKEVQLHE